MADFEQRMTELEAVVERLEQGELPLDEAVRLFEQGMNLSESCKKELNEAEGRIQVLIERAGGTMQAQELEVETDVDEEEEGPDPFRFEEGEDEE
ncbi:exodeoxyribonuclease VII small subunit [Edaphobacter aggregans]|uniref:exodeoxyribonuclease VII small subunit n=1 Tax=Edaphobacter aggregans TaxID=570835 RepID=UPI00068AADAB|nr:exodeoxyribonuclease VII small subunit [Edaphobacter aggregans]